MHRTTFFRPRWRALISALLLLPLTGCGMTVLDPAGDVARQQAHLIVWSTILMLLIIVPVMALTIFFAWRYRAGGDADYRPDWDHSTALELVIWSAPLLIIIVLGALTWITTHTLDPYRALGRIAPGRPVPGREAALDVDVVALDWKWLFIYPGQGIATVNDLVIPTDRPVRFHITSNSVMNSFFVPAMAGQIYAMRGMVTTLNGIMNRPGRFEGMSANYSGAGFSGMHFPVRAVGPDAFTRWAGTMKATGAGQPLDTASYARLAQPSESTPPVVFGAIDGTLFDRIVGMCALPGERCTMAMPVTTGPAAAMRPAIKLPVNRTTAS